MTEVQDIWVYLAETPLLWLTLTLLAYMAAHWLFIKSGDYPLLHPVFTSVAVLIGVLYATGTSYESYFDGAQFVHFLLGPATVAFAVPLYANFKAVKQAILPVVCALVAGSATAIVSAVGIALALGASFETLTSIVPKSVTTPIAMGIAETLGGLPSLTAALVLLTGIIGAMLTFPTLRLLRLDDHRAEGLAAGVSAHGIATARAFQISEVAGTFAAVGMALNGVATALLAPLLLVFFS